MQEVTNKPPKKDIRDLIEAISHLLKLRSKNARPEDIEPVLAKLSKFGADDNATSALKEVFTDTIAATKDDARSARTDKVLAGGIIAINLVIFQALLSFNPIDSATVMALIALSVAIVTAGGFIFIRYVQGERGIQDYDWKIIGRIPQLALLATWFGITAAIWHVSPLAAIVFFIAALVMGGFCALYYSSLAIRAEAQKRHIAAQPTQTDEKDSSN